MIEGRLGNIVICQAPYNQIANMDFTQYRQGQQNKTGQSLERSKILFGMSNPIDLVEVKIFPPSFKGSGQNDQQLQYYLQRNFIEDVNSLQIVQINELEKIKQKSLSVRDKNSQQEYNDEINSKPKIKMTDSIISETDEKATQNSGVNRIYFNQVNQTNFQ
ncbi:hypothetical protein ABPG72_008619 [Tetrahymena utriculariae]